MRGDVKAEGGVVGGVEIGWLRRAVIERRESGILDDDGCEEGCGNVGGDGGLYGGR